MWFETWLFFRQLPDRVFKLQNVSDACQTSQDNFMISGLLHLQVMCFCRCASCLDSRSCGWCANSDGNGQGTCSRGSVIGPDDERACPAPASSPSSASDITLSWHFLQCPAENECANGNHDCDVTQECDDTLLGFACECREGFVPRMSDSIVHS